MLSRLIWIGLVFMLIIPKPSLAQAEGWSTGCDSNAKPIIATTTGLDYEAACKVYTSCADGGGTVGVCQMRALMTLSEICTTAHCKTEAQIYAAAITMSNNRYNFDVLEPDKGLRALQMALPKALNALQAGDYEGAAAIYLSIPPDVYNHPMLPLSAGLNYELAGDINKALAAYDQAAQVSYLEPLVYYVRGNLLATSGQAEEAAIDFSLLAQYTGDDAVLEKLVKPLVTAFPFPAAIFEDWKAYPVLTQSGGPGGTSVIDLTLETPQAIKLVVLRDGTKMAGQNLSEPVIGLYDNLPATLILNQTDDQVYAFAFFYTDNYGATTTVNFGANPVELMKNFQLFEGFGSSTFVLVPPREPDPRLQFDVIRCPGAALSRLKTGEQGYAIDNPRNPVRLYDAIGGTALGEVYGFEVLDGPFCQDNQAWWQIKIDDGKIGWASENEGNSYRLYLYDDNPIPPLKSGT